LLAVSAQEELTIGELAELLSESQPNVSRHVAPLRRLGLLAVRKQGTRVLVRLADAVSADPVVSDALRAGRELCSQDRTLERIAGVVQRRDAASREFFARVQPAPNRTPDELPAYLMALAPLLGRLELAIDVGTGQGRMLEVLAPLFTRVVAIDQEAAQLDQARERVRARGYGNVELLLGDLDGEAVMNRLASLGPADAVFISRALHHAPTPARVVSRIAALVREGGTVVIVDYAPHEDESMRREQADLWLGFGVEELTRFATEAGLTHAQARTIPEPFRGSGPDRHLTWHVFSARRPKSGAPVYKEATENDHG
jgi:ArsR family transcriptional regulator